MKEYFVQKMYGEPGKNNWIFAYIDNWWSSGKYIDSEQDVIKKFDDLGKAIEHATTISNTKHLPSRVIDEKGQIKHLIPKLYAKRQNSIDGKMIFIKWSDGPNVGDAITFDSIEEAGGFILKYRYLSSRFEITNQENRILKKIYVGD